PAPRGLGPRRNGGRSGGAAVAHGPALVHDLRPDRAPAGGEAGTRYDPRRTGRRRDAHGRGCGASPARLGGAAPAAHGERVAGRPTRHGLLPFRGTHRRLRRHPDPRRSRMNRTGLFIAAAALLLTGCGYNRIQELDERVKQARANTEAELLRRNDLIPNLVATAAGDDPVEERDDGGERGPPAIVAELRRRNGRFLPPDATVEVAAAFAPESLSQGARARAGLTRERQRVAGVVQPEAGTEVARL